MAIKRALALSLLALVATAGVVLATHTPTSVGFTGTANFPMGTLDRSERVEFLSALAGQGRQASTYVKTVRAEITAGGETGWHGHPGPSVVVVVAGTLTVTHEMPGGRCMSEQWLPGQAYFHTGGIHNFENDSATTADFYVTYFVPTTTQFVSPDSLFLTHASDPC